MGLPGVGKSVLVKATLQYIQDRSLFRGGLVITDARTINNCELFVRNLNNQLISEHQFMFGSAKECNQNQHTDCLSTFILIIKKISYIKEDILLVIDNCSELIIQDKQNFKVLISTILATISSIKILLTTRIRLGSPVNEANEEIVVLSGLKNSQTCTLIKKKVNRLITQAEQNALMNVQPNFTKYPQEKTEFPRELHDHHLFKLLGGNPQSIMLITPLLNDPSLNIKLVDLYKMLTTNKLCEILKNEEIEDQQLASLRISVQVSVSQINENDIISMQLFFLMGMLPGGIRFNKLKKIWILFSESSVKKVSQSLKRIISTIQFSGQNQKGNGCPWETAAKNLKYKNLIEFQPTDQLENSADILNTSEVQQTQLDQEYLIYMTRLVRNFAEAMIEPYELKFFQKVLTNFFNKKQQKIYRKNGISLKKNKQKKIRDKIISLEQNMVAFIQRMQDKLGLIQPVKQYQLEEIEPTKRSAARRLSGRKISQRNQMQPFKLNVHQCHSQQHRKTNSEQSLQQFKVFKKNATKVPQFLTQNNQLWDKLMENYQQILIEKQNKKNHLLTFIQRMQRNLTIKPRRGTLSPHHWARLMWKWALKLAIKKIQQEKAGIILRKSKTFNFHLSRGDELEVDSVKNVLTDIAEDENSLKRLEKLGQQIQFKRMSTDAVRNKQNVVKQTAEKMSTEEMTVLYYIANLVLISQHSLVKIICERNLVFMSKASSIFRANVNRYLALCLWRLGCDKEESSDLNDLYKITGLLEESFKEFKKSNCKIGMGIIKFMFGKLSSSMINKSDESFDGSEDFASQKQYFQDAFNCFIAVNYYSGIVVCGKELLKLLNEEQNESYEKTNQLQVLERCIVKSKHALKHCQHPKRVLIGDQESLLSEIVFNENDIDEISSQKRTLFIKSGLKMSTVMQSLNQPATEEKEETQEESYSSVSSYNSISNVSIHLN